MTDFIMPGINGGVLTGMIKEKYSADVILMTGYKPNCSFEEAKSLGASDFFYKPPESGEQGGTDGESKTKTSSEDRVDKT